MIKRIKNCLSFLFLFVLLLQSLYCQTTTYKIRTISFYNVENLFDTIDNPDTFDEDFTGKGKYGYSSRVYWEKIENISKVISEIGFIKTKTIPFFYRARDCTRPIYQPDRANPPKDSPAD